MIQIFSNSLGQEELDALKRVFESRWIGYGSESKRFEKEFGEKIGCPNTLLVNCCTAALYMSMRILDIGPGDEVIIPTINFIGAANAICDSGARPVFADVERDTLNILPGEITRLRSNKTKAVLLLHYGGHPCNMDQVWQETLGLRIIEDSANSIVSKYRGKNCGTLGDIGCFSFDSMKILSVGDGGAIAINDPSLVNRAIEERYLGLLPKGSSGVDSLQEKPNRWWEIEMSRTANRYTSNDIIGAMARVQLKKLDAFIQRRKEIWTIYQSEFAGLEWLECPPEPLPQAEGSYYLYWLRIKHGQRDSLARYLVDNGIYCTFRYFPLHLIKVYGHFGKLANAEWLNESVLNIPLHQNLSETEIAKIVDTVKRFGKKGTHR
ncbi:MAG: DegT/DnrJ/EryC1/StrS family aminotransferase [candidate division KSB1 bacterium]|nr:DegT/DnrJ/EryC1/StrS family aminotransferase [candidate division KSB1 bacterium]